MRKIHFGNYINRGYYRVKISNDKKTVFADESDYRTFLLLLEKALANNDTVELSAYCLNKNGVDLLVFQKQKGGVQNLAKKIVGEYNDRKKKLLLKEENIRVTTVLTPSILNVSKNIHTQPENYVNFPFSSIRAYFYDDVPEWLNKSHIAKRYGSAVNYEKFLSSTR